MTIPKRIHFVWTGKPMPPWVRFNIQQWRRMNPGWEVIVHTEPIIQDNYAVLAVVRGMELSTRSDLLRLHVLRVGGWYFDVDFVPLRPLDAVYAEHNLSSGCFLTKQWERSADMKWVANGVIGIAPDASRAWCAIDVLMQERQGKPVERTTFGPLLTTELTERWPGVASLADPNEFYPIRFNPPGTALEVYRRLLHGSVDERLIGEPYAFHLWMGGKGYHEQPELDELAKREGF